MTSNASPHASLGRLYAATASLSPPITRPGELAGRLGQSAATVTNWASRGVSLAGAYVAQRVLGVNAVWVLDGEGPTFVGAPVSQVVRIDRSMLAKAIESVEAALKRAKVTIAVAARAEIAVVLYQQWDGTLPSIERATSDALAAILGMQQGQPKDEFTS